MTLQEKYAAYEKAKEELLMAVEEFTGKDVTTKQYGRCRVEMILDAVNHVLVKMPNGDFASVHFTDIVEGAGNENHN